MDKGRNATMAVAEGGAEGARVDARGELLRRQLGSEGRDRQQKGAGSRKGGREKVLTSGNDAPMPARRPDGAHTEPPLACALTGLHPNFWFCADGSQRTC